MHEIHINLANYMSEQTTLKQSFSNFPNLKANLSVKVTPLDAEANPERSLARQFSDLKSQTLKLQST